MKKIPYILGFLLLVPSLVSAHVKWFVDSGAVVNQAHNQSLFYNWNSKEVLLWSVIVLIVVLVFGFIDSKIRAPQGLINFGRRNEKSINRVAQTILGLFLISVSFLWQIVILPDFPVVGSWTTALQYLQVLIGFMYVFNVRPRTASVLLLVLCAGVLVAHGWMALLENAILLSLGLYFYIINSPQASWAYRKLGLHAVELVRIGTGISLIALAFTEKFLYPELSLAFLGTHHWNFMQPIFPWFTDKLFVLSTGFAEMIFGILFILGYITRITTVLIALFFASSVVTMFIQSNAWEVEDLVVYSAAILFIFFGHGKTKFFHFNLLKSGREDENIIEKE